MQRVSAIVLVMHQVFFRFAPGDRLPDFKACCAARRRPTTRRCCCAGLRRGDGRRRWHDAAAPSGAEARNVWRYLATMAMLPPLFIYLAVANAPKIIQTVGGRQEHFKRTPKKSTRTSSSIARPLPRMASRRSSTLVAHVRIREDVEFVVAIASITRPRRNPDRCRFRCVRRHGRGSSPRLPGATLARRAIAAGLLRALVGIRVRTKPGQMTLTPTPRGFSSTASPSEIPTTPYLPRHIGLKPMLACRPASEAVLTICPSPPAPACAAGRLRCRARRP